MITPICCSESEDINWYQRSDGTKAEARRSAAEEWSHYTLDDLRVTQGHLRELAPGDCPAHPNPDDRGEWDESEDCRCGEIEEGFYEGCDHRHPDAIPCWCVELPSPDKRAAG